MINTAILELKYQKNPNTKTFFNINIIIFLIVYILGVLASILLDQNYELGFFTFVLSIPILIILFMYMPVFESLSRYSSLDLFEDKIVINKTEMYPIKDIACSIKSVSKGSRLIMAYWTSCVLHDKENNLIGEFFFSIGTEERFFEATAESLNQIITDLKDKKSYDFNHRIKEDLKKFLADKKSYNVGILLLIGMFVLPACIGIVFFILKP